MRLLRSAVACCALCVVPGVFLGVYAQTVGVTKKRIPADPAAQALYRLLSAAQEAIDRQDYETAAQNYQDYLAKKPDDAGVHYDLGYVYTALKRPADAKSEYEKAISLDPKMSAAYLNLGLTLLASDPSAAVAPLQRAAEMKPEDARIRWLLGTALERSGKLQPAIDQYEAAEKLYGKDTNIRLSLGFALLRSGRGNESEAQFRAALSLHPADDASAQAHKGLAQALISQKKLDEGASELAAYLELEPTDTPARIDRASILVDAGKNDDALAELDRAASQGPEEFRALKLRSQVYWEKKQFDEAVPVLLKAAALAPRDVDIPARLGQVYLRKKDYPNAAHWLTLAYNMNPSATDLLAEIVDVAYLNKNFTGALAALDILSKREELPAASWYTRAACYDNLMQAAQALEAYQRFLQMNKDENSDMYFISTARVRALTRELQNKKR
jgi:tetratricopeptide (TPR) repeat protein